MTCGEVLSAAWQACYDRPRLQAELVRQFQAYPSEHIQCLVGDELADLASQSAARPESPRPDTASGPVWLG